MGRFALWSFAARRAGLAGLTVGLVIVSNFILIHSAPGDPIAFLIGEYASPEYYEQVRRQYKLDRPIIAQLIPYLGNVLRGDLGFSYSYQKPVVAVIRDRFPPTLLLTGTAIALSSLFGILLGVVAATRPGSGLDAVTTAATIVGYSLPVFWLAQLLLLTFSVRLHWFPVQGMSSLRMDMGLFERLTDLARHLVLPVVSLTAFYLALVARLMRTKMIETLRSDYILTARAKGLRSATVLLRHALPNAILPVVTVIGYNFSLVFAGSVLTETVFAWPGMGLLIYDAVYARDYPLLLGSFVFIALSVVFFNFVTDIMYGVIDPRVRYG